MDNTSNQDKPFSREYVLNTTAKHIHKCIDLSIQKTTDRIGEFSGNPQKSMELLQTLSDLNNLKSAINIKPL